MTGLFITLEGGEGAGKSTQARLLAEWLRAQGHDVDLTREPGGTPGAEALRELLLFGGHGLCARAEVMAHFAARADHVEQRIAPMLARGGVVICDRFTDSTEAYQGYGLSHGDPAMLGLIATLRGLIPVAPDLTFMLEVPPAVAQALRGELLDSLGPAHTRRLLLRALVPGDADVSYDTRFIDRFLADDTRYLAEVSSVHDWRPAVPVRLYHGREDRTVPYASSVSTLRAMQARGAGSLVSLTDCRAQPTAGHMQCVPPFITFLLGQFAPLAQDL